MPVDLQARSDVRNALIAFMRGEIRAFAFDDVNSRHFGSADPSLHEISRILWGFYDDLIDHRISVTAESWQILQRVVAFLATDLAADNLGEPASPAWPFRSESEWLAMSHLSRDSGLPAFDASIHCQKIHPWWYPIPTLWGIAVILGFILLFGLLLLTRDR